MNWFIHWIDLINSNCVRMKRVDHSMMCDRQVKKGTLPPIRPRVPRQGCPVFLHDLMDQCWHEDPDQRPTFVRVQDILRKSPGFAQAECRGSSHKTDGAVRRVPGDHNRRHRQGLHGGEKTQRRSALFHPAKVRFRISGQDSLFFQKIIIRFPKFAKKNVCCTFCFFALKRFVAQMINSGTVILPETYPSTTVYFSHLDGWDNVIAMTRSPLELTQALNAFYSTCDAIIEKHDGMVLNGKHLVVKIKSFLSLPTSGCVFFVAYKVETVTDSYMVCKLKLYSRTCM